MAGRAGGGLRARLCGSSGRRLRLDRGGPLRPRLPQRPACAGRARRRCGGASPGSPSRSTLRRAWRSRAGGLTVCAVAAARDAGALRRLVARAKDVERQLARPSSGLTRSSTRETEARAAEIERTLARARADSLSRLVGEERRIAEERRAALAERERKAERRAERGPRQGGAASRAAAGRVDGRPRADGADAGGAADGARPAPAAADGRGASRGSSSTPSGSTPPAKLSENG